MTGGEIAGVLAAGFGAGILTSTVGVASLLSFPVLVALLTNVFDGAAVVEGVLPQPHIAERRVSVLATLLTAALPES